MVQVMSEVKRYRASVGNGSTSRREWVYLCRDVESPKHEQLFKNVSAQAVGQISELQQQLDAERLRADTAEAELAKANDKIDKAWRRSHELDNKAYIPGAFDAWRRPVSQFLPYDFSGNPGTNATQYCNGWNDCGGYWKAHATEVEAKLAAAEQRIEELESKLHKLCDFSRFVIKCVRRNGEYAPLSMQEPHEIEALLAIPTESGARE